MCDSTYSLGLASRRHGLNVLPAKKRGYHSLKVQERRLHAGPLIGQLLKDEFIEFVRKWPLEQMEGIGRDTSRFHLLEALHPPGSSVMIVKRSVIYIKIRYSLTCTILKLQFEETRKKKRRVAWFLDRRTVCWRHGILGAHSPTLATMVTVKPGRQT
jgi:hypothetical protein